MLARAVVRPAWTGSTRRVPFDLAQAWTRWTDDDVLLFTPVQYYDPPGRTLWHLAWFGRAERTDHEVVVAARVSVGSLMTALCLLTLAPLMGALLLALRYYVLAAIAFGSEVLVVRG